MVIGWDIDRVNQVLTLPQSRRVNLSSSLENVSPRAARVSKRKKFHLLGLLLIAITKIAGLVGILSRIQNVLNTVDNRCIILTPQVHDEKNMWRGFITSFAIRKTHLREIKPHPPTWKGMTDTFIKGIGGLC